MFAPLPVFPPIRRDITVKAPLNLTAFAIQQAIEASKPANLEEVFLADLYEPNDKQERNLTFRLIFRHPERTLQDSEVDKVRDKVASSLVQNLPVQI